MSSTGERVAPERRDAPRAETLEEWEPPLALPLLLPLGAAICSIGAMAGVGGGLFTVPALYMLWRLPLRASVATGLVLVAVNSATATVAEMLHPESALNWPVVAVLLLGALIGAQIGFAAQKRLPARLVKQVFVVVLALAGAKVCWEVFHPPAAMAAQAFDLGTYQVVAALLAGFGGGFLAPMLGVGGGLLIVPGLLLGAPQLGYAAVRACSMAAATVTSARSAWLHARNGHIEWRCAAWLGAGALVGGTLGVQLFHVPGMEAVARIVLTSMLWFVAYKFLREIRQAATLERDEDRKAA